jgi:DNA-binding MarR family transcriptional regulator
MAGAEEQIIHNLLTAIDDDASISQRKLSRELGIAVGSVNWYLKRCVNKGLVKFKQAPVKRYIYYLTLKGFEEKARLTTAFLQSSLKLYRSGRKECFEYFQKCSEGAKTPILLAGDSDFAEIAVLSSLETPARISAVIDGSPQREKCAGVPVVDSLSAAIKVCGGAVPQAILLTAMEKPKSAYFGIKRQIKEVGLPADLVHVPKMLNLKVDR